MDKKSLSVWKGLCDIPESLFWVRGENLWETGNP